MTKQAVKPKWLLMKKCIERERERATHCTNASWDGRFICDTSPFLFACGSYVYITILSQSFSSVGWRLPGAKGVTNGPGTTSERWQSEGQIIGCHNGQYREKNLQRSAELKNK